MDKESYNIDDILSEVRKRREENEKSIKEKTGDISETHAAENNDSAAEFQQNKSFPKSEESPLITENEAKKPPLQEEEPEKEPPQKEQSDEMVDILALSKKDIELPEYAETVPAQSEKTRSRKKTTKIVISVIAVIILLAVAAAIVIANDALDRIVSNNKETVATTESRWAGMDKLVENFNAIDETEATELSSLQDMIKTWYYNGSPCSSTHVLNVLLVGEDTRGTEILDEGTRADSAIIVSINIDTGVITMTSILRDAYTYWETTEGDESTGQFGKINGAMSTGNINAYINCIEHMYKIDIDNYVIVNFDSFETIVDTLGGVTLELTSAEINEINSHQKRYGNVTIEKTFEGRSGKIKLNGKQALAYCRIRKLDSDNMRADRQKTCLVEIFKQTKKASTVKLIKIINNLIPYVKTSFGKSELIKIARYAFSQGWLDYDIYMQNLPEHNLKGGTAFGAWVWKADFPADAYNLQSLIYGKSCITLAHIRVDTKNCPETGFYSRGAGAMYTTITNDHYGEVTTITTTTKKKDASK